MVPLELLGASGEARSRTTLIVSMQSSVIAVTLEIILHFRDWRQVCKGGRRRIRETYAVNTELNCFHPSRPEPPRHPNAEPAAFGLFIRKVIPPPANALSGRPHTPAICLQVVDTDKLKIVFTPYGAVSTSICLTSEG